MAKLLLRLVSAYVHPHLRVYEVGESLGQAAAEPGISLASMT